MKYALAYNEFHNLESIGIEGKSEALIKYAYKNGNGRLKQMTYANGHTMKAVYNSIGQMVAEKWFETEADAASSTATPIAHYKYVYDGDGNIVRSIDISGKKEYNYEYEEGKIIRAAESDITLNGEIVTGRTLVYTVRYYYNTEGQLTKKVITSAGKSSFAYTYTNTDTGITVQFTAGGKTVTSQSNTDHLGRKTFDELQLGVGSVSRQFCYLAGEVTEEHIANGKQKSNATTQLVSKITLSNGRTISYEYDAEERITKVIDSTEGTTVYTYDALGQLLTETKNDVVVNTMTYDNYGNIKTKNGKTYTYDSTWKDLLKSYDGKSITYDAQGNPTSYLGHTLTWEKGRQLKKFDNNEYTYNANGIRTSKKVNGVLHTYTLDGTKILRETWGSNTLIPLYDNEDAVCGIIYNNTPYYFLKNLQGDIIAITDATGTVVAEYSYDAWGKCTITCDCCGIASINPYRYRGYYYDDEIGLYYLQSRYYNSVVERFIDSDDRVGMTVLSNNLFAYCENECITNFDPYGYSRIVIDAGHGGRNDKGAVGYHLYRIRFNRYVMPMWVCNVYYEKDFNLKVSLELKKYLKSFGHVVFMTREKDEAVSLETRYTFANDKQVDYFVSIHHNSSNVFKKGFCVLYAGKHHVFLSRILARSISNSMAKNTKLKKYASPASNTELAVLNGTKMPAVLVECGYMGGDLIYCRDNASTIAKAIGKGIINILPRPIYSDIIYL